MSIYTVGKRFAEQFSDYKIKVIPPCISPNRESSYITTAKAVALGDIKSSNVIIFHDRKEIVFCRQRVSTWYTY